MCTNKLKIIFEVRTGVIIQNETQRKKSEKKGNEINADKEKKRIIKSLYILITQFK